MILSIDDFIRKFTQIKESGWIETHRNGDTGIGKTLEDLLDIQENNLSLPDFSDCELKSSRIGSNSMVTLFTKEPLPRYSNKYLLEHYGYICNNPNCQQKILHTTLSAKHSVQIKNTKISLQIVENEDKVCISPNLKINQDIYWPKSMLQECFEQKYQKNLIYVRAKHKKENGKEYFHYIEAYQLNNSNFHQFIKLLCNGTILIDIRIGQYPNGKIHNHGTGFRMHESDFSSLFYNKKQIV